MNDVEKMLVRPEDETAFWEHFPKSYHRSVLHNHLVSQILEDRLKLEKCSPDELPVIQAQIRVRRQLLGFFDRKQPTT